MHAQRVRPGRRRQLPHLVVVGMERQRNERLKAARLILQRARAQHVIDALFVRLDVAVEHRHVRLHPEAVRRAVNRQPPVRVRLVVADLLPHALGEHLRAAAGQRRKARVHQLAQHLLVGHAVEIGEERDLDGGETLQVNLGADALEAAQHLQVVLERQVRMQAVDDVHFGERLIVPHAKLLPRVFERHRVRAGIARAQPRERAEQAARHAHVRRFDADVVVVVGEIAVPPLALAVGERRHLEQIGMLEQAHAVLERQPLAPLELAGNISDHRRRSYRNSSTISNPWPSVPEQLGQVYTPRPNRRFPGDHAKWVERPHGHATVSGERRLYAHATASLTDVGRQEPPLRSASQDTWALGRPYSGAKDAEEGSCSTRLRVPVSAFLFLPHPSRCVRAERVRRRRPRRFTNRSSSPRPGARCPNRKSARRSRCSIASEIEQRHALSTIDLLRTIPGVVAVRVGRRRQPDRRVRARRRIDLQQSAARRHAAERARRRVQLRVAVAGKHRAHRSAARRAFGAVRIGRDGERHSPLLGAPRDAAGRS